MISKTQILRIKKQLKQAKETKEWFDKQTFEGPIKAHYHSRTC